MTMTDDQARELFVTAATEDIPPGVDLLGGFREALRADRKHRVRARAASVGAAAALACGLAIALVASGAQAPPASAALTAVTGAAARTAAQSYRVTAVVTTGYGLTLTRRAFTGEFDPARHLLEETYSSGLQVREVGGYTYYNGADGAGGKTWVRTRPPSTPPVSRMPASISVIPYLASSGAIDPQAVLSMVSKASRVRESGPASGPGWTGTAYTFAATAPGGQGEDATGTVEADRQGRVRVLDAVVSVPFEYETSTSTSTSTISMTFSDFGLPVTVTAPPRGLTVISPGS